MKTVSDDLFRLIKSLSRPEKGYFKKYAVRNTSGEKNQYIRLFDAVDSLDAYDEARLKKILGDDPLTKQLSVYKVYLFNLILDSLLQFSINETAGTKIRKLIDHARILEGKALFKESLRLLAKAKELAYKHSIEKFILEILVVERNLMMAMPDKKVLQKRKDVLDQQEELLLRLKRYFDYSWLSDQMVIFVEHMGDYRDEQRERQIKKIMSNPLLVSKKAATDFSSIVYYHHTHLFYSLYRNDIPAVQAIIKDEIKLLEEQRFRIDENPKNYVSALINLLLFSNILKKREDVREAIVKLNHLRKRLRNKIPLELEIHITCHAAYAELLIYTKNLDLVHGRMAVKKTEDALSRFGDDIPRQLKVILLSHLSIYLFITKDYEGAVKYINQSIDSTGVNFRNDIHFFSKIFLLMAHYELGNFDLLEYLSESTYRYLKDKNYLHPIESALISFIKKALRARNKAEMKSCLEDLAYSIGSSNKELGKNLILTLFDFDSWIKSKLESKDMIDYLRSKSAAAKNNH